MGRAFHIQLPCSIPSYSIVPTVRVICSTVSYGNRTRAILLVDIFMASANYGVGIIQPIDIFMASVDYGPGISHPTSLFHPCILDCSHCTCNICTMSYGNRTRAILLVDIFMASVDYGGGIIHPIDIFMASVDYGPGISHPTSLLPPFSYGDCTRAIRTVLTLLSRLLL
jgi:regulator of extracellular matrix RemA (YlzA/DUF370 family)